MGQRPSCILMRFWPRIATPSHGALTHLWPQLYYKLPASAAVPIRMEEAQAKSEGQVIDTARTQQGQFPCAGVYGTNRFMSEISFMLFVCQRWCEFVVQQQFILSED